MKIYKVMAFGTLAMVAQARWASSKKAAAEHHRDLVREGYPADYITVSELDVPSGKAGLIFFLNKNCT